jgi:hypothetical protein
VALVIIVAFSFSSVLITAMPFGYPMVKLVDMTEEQRAVCIMVIAFNLASMFFVSCWCYFQILRQRGKFGQNSIGVINDAVTNPATPGVNVIKLYFVITDTSDK